MKYRAVPALEKTPGYVTPKREERVSDMIIHWYRLTWVMFADVCAEKAIVKGETEGSTNLSFSTRSIRETQPMRRNEKAQAHETPWSTYSNTELYFSAWTFS